MKQIQLTQNKVAIVCDCHMAVVSGYRWFFKAEKNGTGYACRQTRAAATRQRTLPMHRLIMGDPAGLEIDHINGDKLDNRCENLRVVTKRQNIINRPKQSNNTSGYKGVQYRRDRGTWRAVIRHNGKPITIGSYKTAEEASEAYLRHAKQIQGEYMYVAQTS